MLQEAQAMAADTLASAGARESFEELVTYYLTWLTSRAGRVDVRPVSDDGF